MDILSGFLNFGISVANSGFRGSGDLLRWVIGRATLIGKERVLRESYPGVFGRLDFLSDARPVGALGDAECDILKW